MRSIKYLQEKLNILKDLKKGLIPTEDKNKGFLRGYLKNAPTEEHEQIIEDYRKRAANEMAFKFKKEIEEKVLKYNTEYKGTKEIFDFYISNPIKSSLLNSDYSISLRSKEGKELTKKLKEKNFYLRREHGRMTIVSYGYSHVKYSLEISDYNSNSFYNTEEELIRCNPALQRKNLTYKKMLNFMILQVESEIKLEQNLIKYSKELNTIPRDVLWLFTNNSRDINVYRFNL